MEVKQLFDILRKEAECSFCIHSVNKPKILPCLHSFCLDCLNKYAATRRRQGHTTFDCPECLATFQLPDNDKFDAFQTAFHKNRLLDILALDKSGTDQQKNCDNCDENVAASSYCFECQTFLCEDCLDKHNGMKVTRTHRQASLQNLQTADVEALIQRPVLCDKPYHEREPLEYYCADCRVCICHKCALVEHNKHSMLDIPGVAKQHTKQINQDVEQMKSRVSECKEKIEKSKKKFKGVEQQIKEARHKAQATVEELIRDLKEHEANIMRELDKVYQTQRQAHLAELKKFEQSLTQLNSAIEYVEAIMRRNLGAEIVQTKEGIAQRYDELVTGQKFAPNKLVRVGFVKTDKLCQTVRQSALGRIVVSLIDPSRSTMVKGNGLHGAKYGVKAEFTVITKNAKGKQCYDKLDQVTVHIQTAAQEEAQVKIEDKKDGTYHVTYVPQRHGQHHVMINVNGQPLTGSPWNVHVTPHQYRFLSSFGSGGIGKRYCNCPSGISVSSTGNIAVVNREDKMVQEFTSDGEFLKGIGQGRLKWPVSVAYTRTDDIIVVDRPDENWQVLMFRESGIFHRRFSPVHLKSPFGVSVTNDGRVIVCDMGDKFVKVLSPDGEELIQSFSAPDCSAPPKYAVYHKEKFFVSFFKDCFKVFDVKGKYLHDIGGEGSGEGQLQSPRGIAIDKFGDLLVVDDRTHRLLVFTTEGEFISKIGDQGLGFGQFSSPEDIAVSKAGHVYVTNYCSNRVQVLI